MGGEIEVNTAEILVVVVHRGQIDDVVDIVGTKLRVRLREIPQPQLGEWADVRKFVASEGWRGACSRTVCSRIVERHAVGRKITVTFCVRRHAVTIDRRCVAAQSRVVKESEEFVVQQWTAEIATKEVIEFGGFAGRKPVRCGKEV